jgi:hypothetical protein
MDIPGGMFIQTTTYGIILFSILICSILVLLLDKTPLKGLYGMFFSQFGKQEEPQSPSPPST